MFVGNGEAYIGRPEKIVVVRDDDGTAVVVVAERVMWRWSGRQ